MAAGKTKNDNETEIAWVARAAAHSQGLIELLRAHDPGDASNMPSDAETLTAARREAEAMTHAQLVTQYLSVVRGLLHTSKMLSNSDANRVATGIHNGELLVRSARVVDTLGAQTQKTKAARTKGGSKTAVGKKAKADDDHKTWAAEALKLIASGKNCREIAGILATKHGVTPKTIRAGLKKGEVR